MTDLPEDITPSESLFIQKFFDEDMSIEEASFHAWPSQREPIKRAMAYLKNNEFVRARFHSYLNQNNLTDLDIAKNLSRATSIAEDDPKASSALLAATKEVAKLKDLYSPPKAPSIAEQLGLDTSLTQINVVNQYLSRAKDAGLTDEDLEELTKSPIIDVEVVPKKDLFDE